MSYHRILSIPAEQVREGDVVVVYRNVEYNWSSFSSGSNHNEVAREKVSETHRDPADGTIYVATSVHQEYVSASTHIQLDCLETFGRNSGDQ